MTDVSITRRKSMTPQRRLRIYEANRGACILCGEYLKPTDKWTIEHAIPLGMGGVDTDDNCGPAHERCRREKDKVDVADIARAKRRKMKLLGIRTKTGLSRMAGYHYDWSKGRYVKDET